MSVRENAPIGAPCWIDLMTSDVEKSRAFYAQLCGWESEEPNPEFGGYFNFSKGGGRVAGGMGSSFPVRGQRPLGRTGTRMRGSVTGALSGMAGWWWARAAYQSA